MLILCCKNNFNELSPFAGKDSIYYQKLNPGIRRDYAAMSDDIAFIKHN